MTYNHDYIITGREEKIGMEQDVMTAWVQKMQQYKIVRWLKSTSSKFKPDP